MVSRREFAGAADLTNNVSGPDPVAHARLRRLVHVCIKSVAVRRLHDDGVSVAFVEARINDLAGGLSWNGCSTRRAVIDAGMEFFSFRYGIYSRLVIGVSFERSRRPGRNVGTILICHLFTLVKFTSMPCPHL